MGAVDVDALWTRLLEETVTSGLQSRHRAGSGCKAGAAPAARRAPHHIHVWSCGLPYQPPYWPLVSCGIRGEGHFSQDFYHAGCSTANDSEAGRACVGENRFLIVTVTAWIRRAATETAAADAITIRPPCPGAA